jgi:hypothetical protein
VAWPWALVAKVSLVMVRVSFLLPSPQASHRPRTCVGQWEAVARADARDLQQCLFSDLHMPRPLWEAGWLQEPGTLGCIPDKLPAI